MNELPNADTTSEATVGDSGPRYHPGVNPDAPPLVRDAAIAYYAELDDLLAHLAAHPAERWVAYYGSQRIGFGTDDLGLLCRCEEQFPDGQFRIYGIDAADKCPLDTVV